MTRLRDVLDRGGWSTLTSWVLIACLAATATANVYLGNLLWAGFTLAATIFVLLPSIAKYDPAVTLRWSVVAMVLVPVVVATVADSTTVARIATYLSVAAVALVVTVELDAYTPVELTPILGIVFVVLATMAAAGTWVVVQWTADALAGTGFFERKAQVMWYLVGATVAGLLAGIVFERYFRERPTNAPGTTEQSG